jgi:hypothetical protein
MEKLAEPVAGVRYRHGGLTGEMKGLGFRVPQEAASKR